MQRVLCAVSTTLATQPTNAKLAGATSTIAAQTTASEAATTPKATASPADASAVSIAPTSKATNAAVAAVPTLARAASHGRHPAITSTAKLASADSSRVAAKQQIHES